MNKTLRATAISALILLPLLMLEALVVSPVFADTVSASKPEPVPYKKKYLAYRTVFTVTNDGNDTQPIYDFHVSVDVTIAAISKPKGWRPGWVLKPSSVKWETNDRRAILNGGSETGFDIITWENTFKVKWWTTDKNGNPISSGNFTVSP